MMSSFLLVSQCPSGYRLWDSGTLDKNGRKYLEMS